MQVANCGTVEALGLRTVRDKLKSFVFTAPLELIESFREAIAQQRIVKANLKLPPSYEQLLEKILTPSIDAPPLAADPSTLDASGFGLFFYIMAQLHGANVTLWEDTKIDYEDHYRKRVACFRLTQSLCDGYIAVMGKVSRINEKSFTSMTVLSLHSFHHIQRQLRGVAQEAASPLSAASPGKEGVALAADGKSAIATRLVNLSNRKFVTSADAQGEWRIFVDVVLGGDSGAHLDFITTLKARSDVADSVYVASTRLPPLPEEEDDICEPVQFTSLKVLRGSLGAPRFPRDPQLYADRKPKPRATGTTLQDIPAQEQQVAVARSEGGEDTAAPPPSPQLSITPRHETFNQSLGGRDSDFLQYANFFMHVVNTSDSLSTSIKCDELASTCLHVSPAEALSSVTVKQRLGVASAGSNRYGDPVIEWFDQDLPFDPLQDRVVVVQLALQLKGTSGCDNYARARLHPLHFDRGTEFQLVIAERRTGASQLLKWVPAQRAITFESATDKAMSWGVNELRAFVFADNVAQQTRYCAGAYVGEDGFVVRRDGTYCTLTLDSLNGMAWEATRSGSSEIPLSNISISTSDYTMQAMLLVDRSEFSPMIFGVKIEISTPTSQSSDSCIIELPGPRDAWITPRAATSASSGDAGGDPDSVKSSLGSLRSQLSTWQLVDGPSGRGTPSPGKPASAASGDPDPTCRRVAPSANGDGKTTIIYHERLGSGAYGTVFKAFDNERGKFIAVKEMRIVEDIGVQRSIVQEFERLQALKHKHIVSVHALTIDDDVARVYMEWMPSGSLASLLQQTGHRLHESTIRRYVRGILEGLVYLHGEGFAHLDLKPANVLLAEDTVKLSDFGTSRSLGGGTTMTTVAAIGTVHYMPSELIVAGKYFYGSDIWSLAASVVELATGRLPWSHLPEAIRSNAIPLMFHIGNAQPPNHCPPIPAHLSADLRRILGACFAPTIAARPSAAALLADPYFTADVLPPDAEPLVEFQRQVSDSAVAADDALDTDTTLGSNRAGSLPTV